MYCINCGKTVLPERALAALCSHSCANMYHHGDRILAESRAAELLTLAAELVAKEHELADVTAELDKATRELAKVKQYAYDLESAP